MGVLYHLRHPLLALDLLREHVVGDLLVFQSHACAGATMSAASRDDYPFAQTRDLRRAGLSRCALRRETATPHDPTNWWIPNRACAEAMLRSAGFEIVDHPEEEVYVCRQRCERAYEERAPWSKP